MEVTAARAGATLRYWDAEAAVRGREPLVARAESGHLWDTASVMLRDIK
jgi:hypothetical protein